MNLRRYFSHYRDTAHDRPWFAIGPVLATKPGTDPTVLHFDPRPVGIYLAIRSHTFAAHLES